MIAEKAQKRASVENYSIIKNIDKEMISQTRNHANSLAQPKVVDSLAQRKTNNSTALHNSSMPNRRFMSPIARNAASIIKIQETQVFYSMLVGVRPKTPTKASNPKRQRQRRNKTLKKGEQKSVAANVMGAIVRGPDVSSIALAHIVSTNPGLYCLEAKGCRNLFQQKSKMEDRDIPSFQYSCEEWCNELAKTCKLEEIALGWGFSCCSLEALKPAIATLKVVTVGLGASLGQDAVELLPTICPLLEEVILYFQVISDRVLTNIMESLRHLQVLALCYCLGEISPLSFKFSMPTLRKLRLERVTPWMTNDHLVILTQNCANLTELLLLGCRLLNSNSQRIISTGWPGLISIHLEDCGEVTRNGVASLFDCKSVEDMLLRHNGPGIQKNFILDAALLMPMLRKLSLDVCDAVEGDFDLPKFADRYFLSIVTIARCKPQRCALDLQKLRRTPVHKETLVLVWDGKNLTRTVIKERV
ncbi:hypothetical protein RHSIM_Rhsim04G0133900 [Rhododendron simsii]|uniref:Uncharacterized protein n=1 Tax=Rhododendron simsii TaxID=118357 RepID=A0A834H2J7_RHOSS|nr:hypothetical protein RHSIM_Rhsim04G0133900 [Rhododendron simsii]